MSDFAEWEAQIEEGAKRLDQALAPTGIAYINQYHAWGTYPVRWAERLTDGAVRLHIYYLEGEEGTTEHADARDACWSVCYEDGGYWDPPIEWYSSQAGGVMDTMRLLLDAMSD